MQHAITGTGTSIAGLGDPVGLIPGRSGRSDPRRAGPADRPCTGEPPGDIPIRSNCGKTPGSEALSGTGSRGRCALVQGPPGTAHRHGSGPVKATGPGGHSLLSLVLAGHVLVDPCPAAPPLTVRGLLGLEPAPLDGCPQREDSLVLVGQRSEWDEPAWPGHGRNDKPVEVVENSTRDHLAERSGICGIRSAECLEVAGPVPRVHDHRRVAESHQKKVHHQTSGPAIAIEKGVSPLELPVGCSYALDQVRRRGERRQ